MKISEHPDASVERNQFLPGAAERRPVPPGNRFQIHAPGPGEAVPGDLASRLRPWKQACYPVQHESDMDFELPAAL